MPPSSLFGPMLAKLRARGHQGSGQGKVTNNSVWGRQGVQGSDATNASSSVYQFKDTLSATNVKSYVLSSDQDIIRIFWNLSVTATGNSTSADILAAIQFVRIIGPGGVLIQMSPQPDFYLFQQRFSPFHALPTATVTTGATATSAQYVLYGVNLPGLKQGVYTLEVTIQAAATFNTSTTALSVTNEISLGIGNCGGYTTHFSYSGLPFTPGANGVNDLAPVASIQGVTLTEVFLTGLTSNANSGDINYVQLQSSGGVLGPRITGGDLVATANAEMQSALFSANQSVSAGSTGYTPTVFLLFPLKTKLVLGNGAHAYFNWNATPASTIVARYYWLSKTG